MKNTFDSSNNNNNNNNNKNNVNINANLGGLNFLDNLAKQKK